MMELQDILDAINKKLVEKWPKRTVYIDVCPVDFARPSFWLTVEQYTQTDANRYLVKRPPASSNSTMPRRLTRVPWPTWPSAAGRSWP